MPPSNSTPTIIGMTITTSTNLQSSTSVADELNHRKMNQRRMLQLMQHPPPPPPISSVVVKSQPTIGRRSLTTNAGDIYEDSDDDSVSSCSMEVMSVNAPYSFYNPCWEESSLRHQRRCGDSEEDEENSTTESTGSFDNQACFTYIHDPESQRSGARRRSQRKLQPQQMARILACSSPEITALCKSSFPLPNEHNDASRRIFQQQGSSDMMSISSYNDDAHRISLCPTDVRMESTSTAKSLFLPPLCPPPALQQDRTVPESPSSPVRTDHSIPRLSNPPTWTDTWLRDGRDAMVEASAELITSSSSETDDPHASFRSSSYPMFHYSDSCIDPTGASRSSRYYHNSPSPQETSKSLIASSTFQHEDDVAAIATDPLSKLSLHRRVSNDKLPCWNDIVVTATSSDGCRREASVIPPHDPTKGYVSNDTSNANIRLEKLVLLKNVTVVSDETMR